MATGYSGSSVTLPIIPREITILFQELILPTICWRVIRLHNTLARPITITSSASAPEEESHLSR